MPVNERFTTPEYWKTSPAAGACLVFTDPVPALNLKGPGPCGTAVPVLFNHIQVNTHLPQFAGEPMLEIGKSGVLTQPF